jgi:hypothetical protein
MGSQIASTSRVYFVSYILIAIVSLCSACAIWYHISYDTAAVDGKPKVNILSTSATRIGHAATHEAALKSISVQQSPVHALARRSLASKNTLASHPSITQGAALKSSGSSNVRDKATAESLLFNDKRMNEYLLKQKIYAQKEKEKEAAFRIRQKHEAFVAENIAKQTASKYDILTFPDKNLKKLTDFEEDSFAIHPESSQPNTALAQVKVPIKRGAALAQHPDLKKEKKGVDVAHSSILTGHGAQIDAASSDEPEPMADSGPLTLRTKPSQDH